MLATIGRPYSSRDAEWLEWGTSLVIVTLGIKKVLLTQLEL